MLGSKRSEEAGGIRDVIFINGLSSIERKRLVELTRGSELVNLVQAD
jgi:hypothetical protein